MCGVGAHRLVFKRKRGDRRGCDRLDSVRAAGAPAGAGGLAKGQSGLATALDPQGDGSPVSWDNPQSGVKGSFAPTGKAYPVDAKVCRSFRTEVERKAGVTAMQGLACADKTGEWAIAEVAPAPENGAKTTQAAR